VLEAHAHGRVALVSRGAGAVDLAGEGESFEACNVDALAERIDHAKKNWDLEKIGLKRREQARNYTWDKIQQKYIDVWKGL
jgi:glycosyltransferase involved in cell wall biosynthesis